MTKPTRRSWALAALVMTAASFTAVAQSAPPAIRSSSFYTVKPDRVGDFLAAAKEYAEVTRANNGARHFSLWMSLTGEREYVLVRYYSKWADIDDTQDPKLKDVAARLTAINSRIMSCVEKYHRVLQSLDADLSIALPVGSTIPMARVLRTWIRPDKMAEYRALVKSDLLPAAQKANMKLFSVSTVRFGSSNYEMNTITALDKWADLDGDGPIVTAMGGREAYTRFLAKLRPLVTRSEYEIYRYMKDQSY